MRPSWYAIRAGTANGTLPSVLSTPGSAHIAGYVEVAALNTTAVALSRNSATEYPASSTA